MRSFLIGIQKFEPVIVGDWGESCSKVSEVEVVLSGSGGVSGSRGSIVSGNAAVGTVSTVEG